MEWCLIVVTNATRFLFCQLIIKIEEPVCTPKTLRTFRTSFRKLCLIICRTNEYFQLVLLTTFTISFYNLLSAFYFMAILTFDLEEGFSETKFQMIVGCCIWGSLSLAQFFHLCLSCERTTKEGDKVKGLLLKIEQDQRQESKEEAKLFREEMLHLSCSYNVCDIFKIDRGIVFTICGAVLTYAATTLQFHLTVNGLLSSKTLLWLTYAMVQCVVLCINCEKVLGEAKRTSLLLTKLELTGKCSEAKYLKHRAFHNEKCEFSIFGIFCISTKFLSQASATTISYLVILIQFHILSQDLAK
ncbi:Hypothetical predicted protein [Cloeon dipterum]|uniref:Gustatory receptor n=1 Tax=Cloeon dipterum TaxID=197152 RepID=A0A8S1CV32_9INSE|nr:Hypothetical predicted protein [Cloeon dipterum]